MERSKNIEGPTLPRHPKSLHDWADDDVSKQDLRVEMGMKSGDNMVGG